jgi:hypothetical protein
MARKSTKNISKVLGGLGAMYALSKLPVGEGVRPEDVNKEDAARDKLETEQRLARLRAPAPAPAPAPAEAPVKSRITVEPTNANVNREPAILKKGGGAVKGWGKARGARAAKVY